MLLLSPTFFAVLKVSFKYLYELRVSSEYCPAFLDFQRQSLKLLISLNPRPAGIHPPDFFILSDFRVVFSYCLGFTFKKIGDFDVRIVLHSSV